MAKQTNSVQKRVKIKVSRPGIHAKSKVSKLKSKKVILDKVDNLFDYFNSLIIIHVRIIYDIFVTTK